MRAIVSSESASAPLVVAVAVHGAERFVGTEADQAQRGGLGGERVLEPPARAGLGSGRRARCSASRRIVVQSADLRDVIERRLRRLRSGRGGRGAQARRSRGRCRTRPGRSGADGGRRQHLLVDPAGVLRGRVGVGSRLVGSGCGGPAGWVVGHTSFVGILGAVLYAASAEPHGHGSSSGWRSPFSFVRNGEQRVDAVVDCVIRWRLVVERGGYPHTGSCRWCEAHVLGRAPALPGCEGPGHPSGPLS